MKKLMHAKKYKPSQERIDALIKVFLDMFGPEDSTRVKEMLATYLGAYKSLRGKENAINRLILDGIGDQVAQLAMESAQ
jgi:hypothetical protein